MTPANNNVDAINVFLIGNNPIELSNIYDKLKEIHNKTFKTEVGFEVKGLFKKIMRFDPACILIDDNVEKSYLDKLMRRLAHHTKTKNIPITVLKNTNKDSHFNQAEEYLLKEGVTSDVLLSSILNAIKWKSAQKHLETYYKKKKSQLRLRYI